MTILALPCLPHDILYAICLQLTPRDLLALMQTCRVLHAFGIADYIWHHIYQDLPLDLSSAPDGHLKSLPANALRCAAVNALRLDKNWRKTTSHINRVTKICSQHTIIGIQPLGPHWFVTLGRAANSIPHISVSRLDHTPDRYAGFAKSTRLASFDSPNTFAFASSLQRGGDKALICTLGSAVGLQGNGLLHVYAVDLRAEEELPHISSSGRLLQEWRIEKPGVLYFAQTFEHIVAAVQISSSSPGKDAHRIVFFNTETGTVVNVESNDLQGFDRGRLQFKLYGEYIALVGVSRSQEVKALIRKIPQEVFLPELRAEDVHLTSWALEVANFRTEPLSHVEFYVPLEPIYDPSTESFPVLVLSQPLFLQKGQIHIFRFPTSIERQVSVDPGVAVTPIERWRPCSTFSVPRGVTVESLCFGRTGHRAVWLEHQWNADEYRLMKASFSYRAESEPLVQPIQTASLVLPFQPHTCRALSFEEANGRMWVGVHTGDIYVLDFLS